MFNENGRQYPSSTFDHIDIGFLQLFLLGCCPNIAKRRSKTYLSIYQSQSGTISVLVHAEALLCFVITGGRNLLHASQDIVASRTIHRVYDQILTLVYKLFNQEYVTLSIY